MVKFASFVLASKKRITSVNILEGALAYYVVSRLSRLLFAEARTNYEIEICSCDELSVNNLFHSKVIHLGGVDKDEELTRFFRTVVLQEGQQNSSANLEEDAPLEEQPHLCKNCRCTNQNCRCTNQNCRCTNQNCGCTNQNCSGWNVFILKILFLLYTNGRGREKKYFGEFASYVISLFHRENRVIKRKDKLFFLFLFFLLFTKTDPWKGRRRHVGERSFYGQLRRRRCDKLTLRAAHKFLRSGLCHVHLIDEDANAQFPAGDDKKRVLIFCKKSLRYLSEVCSNWKCRKNCVSSVSYLNKSSEFTGKAKKLLTIEKHERLKNSPLWKFLHKMNHKRACRCESPAERKKCTNTNTSMERRQKEEGNSCEGKSNQDGQKNVHLCNLPPCQDTYFTLTCVCICLLCNTNCYNHYYHLVSVLRQRRSFHLHERVNHFINELAKVDAKCQHVWNMKNSLLYLYLDMCLKRDHQVVNKRARKKDGQCLSRIALSTDCKDVPTQGLSSEAPSNWMHIESKKKTHASSKEQILKYVKEEFQFFDKILEIKSYNYMATSHVCTFNQLIGFLCVKKKNSTCESTAISKTIEQQFNTVVRKNAYYYAMHNSFLMIHLQDMYLSLVEWLRSRYCVVVRANLFTYCLDLVRGYQLCSDTWWEMVKGGMHTTKNHRSDGPQDGGEGPIQTMSNPMEKIINMQEAHMGYLPEGICFSHHKSTYLEFILFERGRKKNNKETEKNYDQFRKFTPQIFYKKLKRKMEKYKVHSRHMLHLLDKLYSEKIYIHFYSNGLRNVLYCRCNCNFFFLEVVCNVILPLHLKRRIGQKNNSPIGGSHEWKGTFALEKKKKKTQEEISKLLRSLDHYLARELKYLFHEYTRFRVKYSGKKENNFTKRVSRLLKGYAHVRNTWYYPRPSAEGGIKTKRKGWIANGLPSIREPGVDDASSYPRKEKTKQKGDDATCPPVLVSYYGIFFKCIIYTIHEYALQICGVVRWWFTKILSSFVDSEHLEHLRFFHHLLPSFERTKQSSGSVLHDELNLNDNLQTLRKIYLDILQFFKGTKMENWKERDIPFGHLANGQSEMSPRRGSNEIPFLKFLFSANFHLFLCEHRYALYLLREVRRDLHFVFPRVKRMVMRRGSPLWKGPS
ncbi:Uncharacterized protein PKNOH_S100067200 [Plasmodium knowlesi]|uniref:Uncharacterized protein n=1 Tax=Plasmodium knowlesi TaxID=5850 RepID=A0A1Y3DRL6_PLAKN|nr:Uncharacterized protein PKNOH_S100067200 [Plasmodium knowlesi]